MENAEHRLNIGMVFQSFNLFPHLTVFGNLLLAPRYHHLASDAELRQHACELLHKVGMLEHALEVSTPALRRTAAAGGDRPRPDDASADHAVR